LPNLPGWIQTMVEEYGVPAALDATYLLTRDYTPAHWFDELQGLADGCGLTYTQIVQIHMLPELIQASCTLAGAWGPATSTNSLYQLRALDWNVDGPFQLHPSVVVYHPNDGDGHEFAILGWSGWIAGLTGISAAPVGICQKVWWGYTGEMSRSGYPFHYLLRDILQYDSNVDDAVSRISTADRTCAIFVGVGDPVSGFRAIEYATTNVTVFDDRNFPGWPGHYKAPGVVYVDKFAQPSHNKCVGSILQQQYGNINATTFLNYVTPMHQTGDMHIGIYDYQNELFYVANASPYVNGNYTPAYLRPFVRLSLADMWNHQRPQ